MPSLCSQWFVFWIFVFVCLFVCSFKRSNSGILTASNHCALNCNHWLVGRQRGQLFIYFKMMSLLSESNQQGGWWLGKMGAHGANRSANMESVV